MLKALKSEKKWQ